MAWRPPPPAVRRRGTRCPTRATWASGQDWGQSGRGRAAVERPKPAAAPATGLSTSSGPRERRRPTGRGRGTDSARRARRPLHPARKSCRPVPPIAGDAPSGGGQGSRLRGQPVRGHRSPDKGQPVSPLDYLGAWKGSPVIPCEHGDCGYGPAPLRVLGQLKVESELGAALLRRRLFRLFIGVFARGRSLFGAFRAGTAPRTAPTRLFRAASPA